MTESPIEKATLSEGGVVPILHATSRVDRVVVHARGAVVSRTIEFPEEQSAPFDVTVRGISLIAEPGSFKVIGEGADSVSSVQTDKWIPTDVEDAGPSVEKLKELERSIQVLREHHAALEERLVLWRSTVVETGTRRQLKKDGISKRIETALSLGRFIDERVSSIDQQIVETAKTIRKREKERISAALEDAQTSDEERQGTSHPSTELTLRFERSPSGELTIEYVVPYAAIWWPTYTLRIDENGEKASVSIDAYVAQRTSEDWTDSEFAFATSDLLFDVRLPKLHSLRFGRTQADAVSGFRPAPKGVDRLFDSFDAAFANGVPGTTSMVELESLVSPEVWDEGADYDDYDEEVLVDSYERSEQLFEPEQQARSRTKGGGGILGAAASAGLAMLEGSRKKMQAEPAMKVAAPAMAAMAAPSGDMTRGFGGSAKKKRPASKAAGLGGEWLNFDQLMMASPLSHERGRLMPSESTYVDYDSHIGEAEERAAGLGLVHPAISRGMFDYRYEAQGRFDVPSDGRMHRVALAENSTSVTMEYVTVPQRDTTVYREALLENPHPTPLLDGPIDVFSSGQFLTQTETRFVAAGGRLRVGLGEEERLKVVRNARVSEEAAGLLKGKREIQHDIEIEIRSGAPTPVDVIVLDRVPVTDDDDVEIRFTGSDPISTEYDQKARDVKIRGGKKWTLTIDPGQKVAIKFGYTIRIKDKEEIIGGNRREP